MSRRPGIKPKPTALLKLHGTYRDDRRYGDEPTPPVMIPDRPAWLKGLARKKWERLAPLLAKQKCLTEQDEDMLATYCQFYKQLVEITRKLKKAYLSITLMGNVKVSPLLSAQLKVSKQMVGIATEFGLTPSSRTRIAIKPAEEKDPFAELSKRGRKRNANAG